MDLKRKVGKVVDVHLPVMAWLAEHDADMYTCTIRAMSTRMERRLMRNFGEESTKAKCCHLDVGYIIKSLVNPLEALWPNEHLMATETRKVVRAKSVRRMPEES